MLIINPIDSKQHAHAFTMTTTEVDENPESLTSQHGLEHWHILWQRSTGCCGLTLLFFPVQYTTAWLCAESPARAKVLLVSLGSSGLESDSLASCSSSLFQRTSARLLCPSTRRPELFLCSSERASALSRNSGTLLFTLPNAASSGSNSDSLFTYSSENNSSSKADSVKFPKGARVYPLCVRRDPWKSIHLASSGYSNIRVKNCDQLGFLLILSRIFPRIRRVTQMLIPCVIHLHWRHARRATYICLYIWKNIQGGKN